MNHSGPAFWLSVVVSVAMHLTLVVLLAWGWEARAVEKKTVTPPFVSAKLVQLKATAPQAAAPKPQPKVVDLTERRREQERQRQLEDERRRAQQAKQAQEQKARAEKEKAEREKKAEQERLAREAAERERSAREQREAARRAQEQAFADALAEEQALLQAQEDAVVAQSFQQAIYNRVINAWNLPPSARNNMRARVKIQLVPTGRVISVTLLESSGDAAFDRSAEQAIYKVEQFPEVKDIPSHIFERHFREFIFIFQPQDLRQ